MNSVEALDTLEIRIGRIVAAEPFPEARKPAYKLTVDFGEFGLRQSSAQVTNYRREDLPGRLVVVAFNLPPKRIAGFRSEVLVMGADDTDGNVILLAPDEDVPLGRRVY